MRAGRNESGTARKGAPYRGQPLIAFLLLLGGWAAVRVMLWDGGTGVTRPVKRLAPVLQADARTPVMRARPEPVAAGDTVSPPPPPSRFGWPQAAPLSEPRWSSTPLPPAALPALEPTQTVAPAPVPAYLTAGHQLLWMAALSNLPLPQGLVVRPSALAPPAGRIPAAPPVSAPSRPEIFRDPRWSADAWLLLRRGGTVPAAGGLTPATYGASQAGGVIRYRLAPTNRHRPSLYLRGSAALNGSREREAAFGASVRPIAGIPVVAAVEARVNRQPGGSHVRPAAFAYTELPPVALPGEARAEVYAQAGYVGGNFSSAFADGQLRVDRQMMLVGRGELRAGGGVWGGAQKGASRLDLGPTATLGVPLGDRAGARLGVDWRFRVAGDAAPSSGPAVTLSAGF